MGTVTTGCRQQAKTGTIYTVYKETFTPGAVSYVANDAFQVVQSVSGASLSSDDCARIAWIKVYDYLASGTSADPSISFQFANKVFTGVADNAAFNFDGDCDSMIFEGVTFAIVGTDYKAAKTTGGDTKKCASLVFNRDDMKPFVNQDTSGIYFQMYLPDGETFTAGEEITIEIGVELC